MAIVKYSIRVVLTSSELVLVDQIWTRDLHVPVKQSALFGSKLDYMLSPQTYAKGMN